MLEATAAIDWSSWLRRWDAQQSLHLTTREERFTIMLDTLAATVAADNDGAIVALDLACGPGAISQRLLARFPAARTYAVDLDPVLLAIGQGALVLAALASSVIGVLYGPTWSAAAAII